MHPILKNVFKKICFAVCLLTMSVVVNGQDYLIRYNLVEESSTYYKIAYKKDTVKLTAPKLKNAGTIRFEVSNYNPFYWNARITTYKKPADEESGYAGLFNPFNLLGKGALSFLPNLNSLLSLPEEGARGVSGTAEQLKFLKLCAQFKTAGEALQGSLEKYQAYKDLHVRLDQLKFDHQHTADSIKSAATSLVKAAGDVTDFTTEKILQNGRTWDEEFAKQVAEVYLLHELVSSAESSLDKNAVLYDNKTTRQLTESIETTFRQAEAAKANGINFTGELININMVYREIIETPFQYNYIINDGSDIDNIRLQLYARDEALSKDTVVKYFTVVKPAGLRIRNSAGISFTYFKDNNRIYFANADSSIGSGKGNLFTPVLSTFLHFYSNKKKPFKMGGAIGIGIPLQGENKDINFMLGLTAVLGRNEPIMITAGIAGAKVSRLKNDWKTGDKVIPDYFNNLTNTAYGIGGFFTVSFNLSGISLGKKNSD